MKKLLVILMMAMLPVISFAQKGIPRSNNVSVGVKRVTEVTYEKDLKTYEAKVGFQQMAGLNFGAYEFDYIGAGLSYVGGYRFNDVLFAGGGVEINTTFVREFYIPIYAQVRTYVTKSLCRPYASLSLGGYYSNSYSTDGGGCGFYADFSFGVDVRINDRFNVFASLGINNMGVQVKTGLSF